MNKVENIKINGIVFYIEDDAFKSLSRYLDTLKKYFASQPDGMEVIGDIEARIAELFSDKGKGANIVISLRDVQEVEDTLGAPEAIANVDPDASGSGDSSASSVFNNPPPLPSGLHKIAKKFYRDPERRILGGICAGLSVLWGVPAWVIRLLFFLSPFLTLPFTAFMLHMPPPLTIFFLTLLYFLLWIFVPKANTPARKLAMLGQPVTVDGLRYIREQASDSGTSRFISQGRDWASLAASKVFGVVFLLSGLMVLFGALAMLLFQSQFLESDWKWAYYPVAQLLPDMFHPTVLFVWEVLMVLSILIPVFLLIALGIKFLFGKMNLTPMVWGALVGCWVLVLVSTMVISFTQTSLYRFDESVSADQALLVPVAKDTLVVKVKGGAKYPNSVQGAFYNVKEEAYLGMPRVYVEASSSDKWEVCVRSRARGNSRLVAAERAEQISYSYHLDSQVLWLDPYFSVTPKDKWAVQRVSLTIKVPKGKYLHMDPSLQVYYGHFDGNNYWEHRDRGTRGLMLSTNEEGRLFNVDDEQPEKNVIENNVGAQNIQGEGARSVTVQIKNGAIRISSRDKVVVDSVRSK